MSSNLSSISWEDVLSVVSEDKTEELVLGAELFCSRTVTNNDAPDPTDPSVSKSEAILSIKNDGPDAILIEIESADADPIDLLIVNSFGGPIAGNPSIPESGTGAYVDNTANPAPDALNGSALVGEYGRNGGELFDNFQYSTAAITDASLFVTGSNTFFLDVYTETAPIGSTIIVQLESSATSMSTNYPTGRHSRYQGVTTTQNAWERLEFTYIDRLMGQYQIMQ